MIYMFLSNNPSSGDINSSNLSCFAYQIEGNLFCCLIRPKSTAMVIAVRSVHLTTLFPGQA